MRGSDSNIGVADEIGVLDARDPLLVGQQFSAVLRGRHNPDRISLTPHPKT